MRWQSSAIVAVGVVVGVPCGTIAGRLRWQAFARRVEVVSHPVAPWLVTGSVIAASLGLASLLALAPARHARRLEIAESLRAR